MNSRPYQLIFVLFTFLFLLVSCKDENAEPVQPHFVFKTNVDGNQLEKGVMKYTNKAGNIYQVDELQYFISEIQFTTTDGQVFTIESDSAIHYVDIDIASTLKWTPSDLLPVTSYSSISFVFGINEAKNKIGLFVNPPERDMFWPDMMGGGYHYMKMNGKWKATGDTIKPFNLHLGIGMNEDGTVFYQNYFKVTIPLNIKTNPDKNEFTLTMNIEKWFETPNLWDWNVTGGQIMQNQDAMLNACKNGANAFEISYSGK
ncbi:MAG: MbnP family protein [Bacteroidales bacterium]